MHRVLSVISCLLALLPVSAQSGVNTGMLTIRESMSIVASRRHHLMMNEDEFELFFTPLIRRYGYQAEDFLEGVGTCSFWQYIKGGYTIHDTNPDDYFIPDDKQRASTVAIINCEGIGGIGDDTCISVELRVYSEDRRDELLQQMRDIGFIRKSSENKIVEYTWQSYSIYVTSFTSRGHRNWRFDIRLNSHDYASTKWFQYADSSKVYKLMIDVEYPISGHPVLQRRIRTFIMEALERDLVNDWPIARFNGDASNAQALVDYYGRKGVTSLKQKQASADSPCIEETTVSKVAENDYYVSFQVLKYGWYGGVGHYLIYGTTFRKSDGKRLHVIANPANPQFLQSLNKILYFEEEDDVSDEFKDNLPMPKYEPYLTQIGVRFAYQKYEISSGAVGYIIGETSLSEIREFLSEEVKKTLNGLVANNTNSNERSLNSLRQRLTEILSAVVTQSVELEVLSSYFTKIFTANYIRECHDADKDGRERPRIWWQESDSDPESFNIIDVALKTEDEAFAKVVIWGEAPEGVRRCNFNIILRKEREKWLIDKITDSSEKSDNPISSINKK